MNDAMLCSSAYAKLFLCYSAMPPEDLLQGTQLSMEDLQQHSFIEAAEHQRIIHNLIAYIEDPAWAARSAERFSISAHGPIGFAALSAPTLADALAVMVEFHDVRTNTFGAKLEVGAEICRYRMWDQTGDIAYARVLAESTLRILQSLVEAVLLDTSDIELRMFFDFPSVEYADQLEAIYGVPCEFDAGFTGFEFSAVKLNWPSPLYDEETYRANMAQCRTILESIRCSDSFSKLISEKLRGHFDRVIAGQTEGGPPDMSALATTLHITSRTLNRRLSKEGVHYKTLLEEIRRDYARSLLKQQALSISEVSDRLGYGEQANFGRAFRKWYGQSPTAWREQNL